MFLQKDAISFLVGEGQFANNKIYTQLVMNLNTGEGKTYVDIVFAALKRLKTAYNTYSIYGKIIYVLIWII